MSIAPGLRRIVAGSRDAIIAEPMRTLLNDRALSRSMLYRGDEVQRFGRAAVDSVDRFRCILTKASALRPFGR